MADKIIKTGIFVINEGQVKRGGVNIQPTTPPPAPPKAQGGTNGGDNQKK